MEPDIATFGVAYIQPSLGRYPHGVTKRLIDIDDGKLAAARELLGTTTMKATVDRALEEVLAGEKRRALLERLRTGSGLNLPDDPDDVRRSAWR
jgi:Arc/MetJ family transcription regulator